VTRSVPLLSSDIPQRPAIAAIFGIAVAAGADVSRAARPMESALVWNTTAPAGPLDDLMDKEADALAARGRLERSPAARLRASSTS
jgi:hypothetical protein